MSDNIKKQKRIIAEESQSPDRWLREPRNNQMPDISQSNSRHVRLRTSDLSLDHR